MKTKTSVEAKRCAKCVIVKAVDEFPRNRTSKDGRYSYCRSCRADRSDPIAFLSQKWTFMQQRVYGSNSNADRATNSWFGKDICTRAEFIAWATGQDDFWTLFDAWVAAGQPRALNPSIDRIDTTDGYVIGNMRFITQSENSRSRGQHDS